MPFLIGQFTAVVQASFAFFFFMALIALSFSSFVSGPFLVLFVIALP